MPLYTLVAIRSCCQRARVQGTRWRARASVTHLPSHRPAGRNQQLHRHRKTQARAACRQRCLDRVYRHRGVLLTTYGMILHNSEVLAVSAEHDPDDGPLWDVMILDEVSIHPRDVRICPAGWVAWVALVAFFMMPYDHAVRRRWLAGGRVGHNGGGHSCKGIRTLAQLPDHAPR